MTVEQLLNTDVSTLEKMSDDELRTHFKPYIVVCQPPEREKKVTRNVVNLSKPKKRTLEEQMKDLATMHGVDLDATKAREMLPPNLR